MHKAVSNANTHCDHCITTALQVGDTRAGQLHLAQAIRASAAAPTATTTAVTALCSVLSVPLPTAARDSPPLRTLQQRWAQQYVNAYGLPEPSVLAAAAQAAAVQLVADSTSDSTMEAAAPLPPRSGPRGSPFLTESAEGGRGPPGIGHVSGHVAGANATAVGAAAFQNALLFDAMLGDSDEDSEFDDDGAEEFVDDMMDEAVPPQVGFGE
jgi:hypothetical protein